MDVRAAIARSSRNFFHIVHYCTAIPAAMLYLLEV